MADTEKDILELEAQFLTASGIAFTAAREQALASGESILISDQGVILRVYPDGRREVVKRIEPPTVVVPGTKFSIG